MKRLVVLVLAWIGAVVVLGALVVVAAGLLRLAARKTVPERTILEIDFERPVVEYVAPDPLSRLLHKDALVLADVLDALETAREDERVVGLVAEIGAAPMGLAHIQELRDAVTRFREAGKRAVAFSETFGEVGPGNGGYYLATAFDEIVLQPSGDVGLTGLLAETPFLRGTLDKLGVVPRGDHRYEYKNALNIFTERDFTEAHREATESLVRSLQGQMIAGIAAGRGLSEEAVRALLDEGPFLAEQARAERLVDRLAYRDEIYREVKERAGDGAELLYVERYLERAGRPYEDRGHVVAVIYGVGGVARGPSEDDPFGGEPVMGSDTLVAAFRDAVRDEEVEAILFRVDSPGGSYVASDAIWRATVLAREADKPVVVSMGNAAASGGYFVSTSAAAIVAEPATLTGSIGVLNLKLLTTGFWEKLGVHWGVVAGSEAATYWSSTQDFTPEQWERFQAWLDRVYEDFTGKVAEGRGLELERVLEIAKGRVWTGEDALGLGLVDALGGRRRALELVRREAGLAADAPLRLRVFPRPRSPIEQWLAPGRDSSEEPAALALLRVLRMSRPALAFVRRLEPNGVPGVLLAPEVATLRTFR